MSVASCLTDSFYFERKTDLARIYPLFSSSSANAHFVGTPSGGILIDAGASCKRLVSALLQNDIPASAVSAVFITHDHADHINGLKVFAKTFKVPVYASAGTLDFLAAHDLVSPETELYEIGSGAEAGGFFVNSYPTPHDAAESVGYKIHTPDGKICCVCTDLGHVTERVDSELRGSDLVLLESNYDESMLRSGPYPYLLKQRIASKVGHLSNSDSAREVRLLIESGTRRIILGHLSRENNTPRVAENTLLRTLGEDFVKNRDYVLTIAPVETQGLGVVF